MVPFHRHQRHAQDRPNRTYHLLNPLRQTNMRTILTRSLQGHHLGPNTNVTNLSLTFNNGEGVNTPNVLPKLAPRDLPISRRGRSPYHDHITAYHLDRVRCYARPTTCSRTRTCAQYISASRGGNSVARFRSKPNGNKSNLSNSDASQVVRNFTQVGRGISTVHGRHLGSPSSLNSGTIGFTLPSVTKFITNGLFALI